MKTLSIIFVLALMAGCASTHPTSGNHTFDSSATGEQVFDSSNR